ncbi:uncharacterized protein LOC142528865 isoform X2 [Primulina tabacum]|uniref:uncharacterized protein LOC142528865 isoform X2 n=1 Tax=Primulina tabacum TaxID=48773 RepID=UPI003F5A6762
MGSSNRPDPFGRVLSPTQSFIHALDEKDPNDPTIGFFIIWDGPSLLSSLKIHCRFDTGMHLYINIRYLTLNELKSIQYRASSGTLKMVLSPMILLVNPGPMILFVTLGLRWWWAGLIRILILDVGFLVLTSILNSLIFQQDWIRSFNIFSKSFPR